MQTYSHKVSNYIAQQQLWKHGDELLLAISGGMDSMLLLHFLLETGNRPGLVHLNFQLRGQASDDDQALVESIAARHQLPLYIHAEDAAQMAKREKMGLEEAAREIRYRYLYHIAYANGYKRILTAHHARDHAETILLHQVRGSGPKGLSGIPVRNQLVVRPFLCLKKEEIRDWARSIDLPYRDDHTNEDLRFSRNRIRHEVLPVLEQLNPNLEETLLENGRIQQEIQLLAEREADHVLKRVCSRKGQDLYISKKGILLHPAARTILFRLLHPYGFQTGQLNEILEHPEGSGKWQESGRFRLISDRQHWILTGEEQNQFSWQEIRDEDRQVHLPGIKLVIRYLSDLDQCGEPHTDKVCVRADDLEFPLVIRPWRQGDYLYPFGMYKANGKPAKKKVSDLLTDKKLSLPEKERTLVLCSGDRILWVLGIRQDERSRVTPDTRRILKIKMLPDKGSMYY